MRTARILMFLALAIFTISGKGYASHSLNSLEDERLIPPSYTGNLKEKEVVEKRVIEKKVIEKKQAAEVVSGMTVAQVKAIVVAELKGVAQKSDVEALDKKLNGEKGKPGLRQEFDALQKAVTGEEGVQREVATIKEQLEGENGVQSQVTEINRQLNGKDGIRSTVNTINKQLNGKDGLIAAHNALSERMDVVEDRQAYWPFGVAAMLVIFAVVILYFGGKKIDNKVDARMASHDGSKIMGGRTTT